MAFPCFVQIVINKRYRNLVPTIGTLGIKRMRDDILSYMTMNKRGKKQHVGELPLIKFGRFVGDNEVADEQGTPVAIVAEEHDIPPTSTGTQAGATTEELVSESSSSSSEEILVREKEPIIPPLTRVEREDKLIETEDPQSQQEAVDN